MADWLKCRWVLLFVILSISLAAVLSMTKNSKLFSWVVHPAAASPNIYLILLLIMNLLRLPAPLWAQAEWLLWMKLPVWSMLLGFFLILLRRNPAVNVHSAV